ncbi:hypothetical protein [Avibacterium paragallinarum]|uniref:hypothetical protein n=1 Tax=Avibacterium paragallinarum TaxID=728 RepID=UPI001FD633FB|nr:hypothetical protein [Avibacterium paragallinarum]
MSILQKQILAKDKAKQSEMDAWMNERYLTALKEGRDGLGTVIVNSAGNERLKVEMQIILILPVIPILLWWDLFSSMLKVYLKLRVIRMRGRVYW